MMNKLACGFLALFLTSNAAIARDFAKVGYRFSVGSKARVFRGDSCKDSAEFGREVEEAREFVDFETVEHSAFDAESGERGARVGAGLELQSDGRAS